MRPIKKAMILAAGLGRRARPLTLVKPKALFPVLNRPVISYNLELLSRAGIKEVAVNTHHLASQVEKHLAGMNKKIHITTFHEEEILGTGGALKNAASFLSDGPFMVVNGVILTRLNLNAVIREHRAHRPAATLVLCDCPRFNIVAVDQEGWIRGFRGEWTSPPEGRTWRTLAFTGIHVLEPKIMSYIPEGPYDIIHSYQAMIRAGLPIRALVIENLPWWKIETREDYLKVHQDLLMNRSEGPVLAGSAVRIDPEAEIRGWASLGEGVVLERGSVVQNSVLWKGAGVAAGVRITDSVLAERARAESDLIEGVKIG